VCLRIVCVYLLGSVQLTSATQVYLEIAVKTARACDELQAYRLQLDNVDSAPLLIKHTRRGIQSTGSAMNVDMVSLEKKLVR